jgi:UDP-3-O-acyl-N-acetylglucosamine deacetylase
MQRLRLLRPLNVKGNSFLGIPSSIFLLPTDEPGWYVRFKNQDDVALRPEMLEYKLRRLVLRHGRQKLQIVEHLLALRGSGLDNVCIVPQSGGIPYFGHANGFWRQVVGNVRNEGHLARYTIRPDMLEASHLDGSFVHFHRNVSGKLILKVDIDYRGIGSRKIAWDITRMPFHGLATARPPGIPRHLKFVQRLANRLKWPHTDAIIWPQDMTSDAWLEETARHRALDILGALATVMPQGGMLEGVVHSSRAGHRHDTKLIRLITESGGVAEIREQQTA